MLDRLEEGRKEVEERPSSQQLRQVQAWRRQKAIIFFFKNFSFLFIFLIKFYKYFSTVTPDSTIHTTPTHGRHSPHRLSTTATLRSSKELEQMGRANREAAVHRAGAELHSLCHEQSLTSGQRLCMAYRVPTRTSPQDLCHPYPNHGLRVCLTVPDLRHRRPH